MSDSDRRDEVIAAHLGGAGSCRFSMQGIRIWRWLIGRFYGLPGLWKLLPSFTCLPAEGSRLVEVEVIKRCDDEGVGDSSVGDGALHIG